MRQVTGDAQRPAETTNAAETLVSELRLIDAKACSIGLTRAEFQRRATLLWRLYQAP